MRYRLTETVANADGVPVTRVVAEGNTLRDVIDGVEDSFIADLKVRHKEVVDLHPGIPVILDYASEQGDIEAVRMFNRAWCDPDQTDDDGDDDPDATPLDPTAPDYGGSD